MAHHFLEAHSLFQRYRRNQGGRRQKSSLNLAIQMVAQATARGASGPSFSELKVQL